MFTDKPVIREIEKLDELERGMFVRISDGTKRPPAHHRKKLEHWERYNCEKWIDQVTPSHGLIGVTLPHPDKQVAIRATNHVEFADIKVELLAEA